MSSPGRAAIAPAGGTRTTLGEASKTWLTHQRAGVAPYHCGCLFRAASPFQTALRPCLRASHAYRAEPTDPTHAARPQLRLAMPASPGSRLAPLRRPDPAPDLDNSTLPGAPALRRRRQASIGRTDPSKLGLADLLFSSPSLLAVCSKLCCRLPPTLILFFVHL